MHFDYSRPRFAWPNIDPSYNYYQHAELYNSIIIISAFLLVSLILSVAAADTIFDNNNNAKASKLTLLSVFISKGMLLCLSILFIAGTVHMTSKCEDKQIQAQISMVNAAANNKNNRYVKVTNNKPVKAVAKNPTLKLFVDEAKPSNVHENVECNNLLALHVKYFNNSQAKFNKGSVLVQYKKAKEQTHYEVYTRHVKLTKLGKKYIGSDIKTHFDNKNIAVVTIYVKSPAVKK